MDCYAEADFLTLLNPERDIPSDIVIKFVGKEETIFAHKFVLAKVSPVFRKQFYGPWSAKRTASGGPEGSKSGESGNLESKGTPETGGSVGPETGGGESGDPEIGGSVVILEKGFSYSAFSSFIRHVYGDKTIVMSCTSFEGLFELFALAKYYLMEKLAKVIHLRVSKLEVTLENILVALATLLKYKNLESFDALSFVVSDKIKSIVTNISMGNLNHFYEENFDLNPDLVRFLIRLLADSKPVKPGLRLGCLNCHMPREECKDGDLISSVTVPYVGLRFSNDLILPGHLFEVYYVNSSNKRNATGERIYNLRRVYIQGCPATTTTMQTSFKHPHPTGMDMPRLMNRYNCSNCVKKDCLQHFGFQHTSEGKRLGELWR